MAYRNFKVIFFDYTKVLVLNADGLQVFCGPLEDFFSWCRDTSTDIARKDLGIPDSYKGVFL